MYWGLLAPNARQSSFALLDADQVSRHQLDAAVDQGKERALSVTIKDGPSINVSAPSGDNLSSTVDFEILLRPKDGFAVDMDSLKIEYKLGPAWVNLTRRIMKQASVSGTRFSARGAELPPGNHSLRLSVQDINGRNTEARVSFSVSK